MSPLFFDKENMRAMQECVKGKDLEIGDTVILLVSDLNIIHHFEEYTGPLDFVDRIAKFTNGRGCSICNDGDYTILRRIEK